LAEVRFQLDEHMNPAVAAGLRRVRIDVITTVEAGLLGAPDTVQLAHAHAAGRVMVTQDRDYLRLSQEGAEHSGIAYCAQGSRTIGEIIAGLIRLHQTIDAEQMRGRVHFIPRAS
jgi:hypothetical protein